MNGAERLVRTLGQAGVRTIFSLSGNQIMPVYDACIDGGIRIVHVRHEAAAVYMADAWAQLTGEIGVALLTAGPGFANGLSPLYSAHQAESPVVLLSGDSPLAQDGTDAFQEMDQTAMTAPLVKRAVRVMNAADMEHGTMTAIRTARAGRQGPVHLALPFDVLNAEAPGDSACEPDGFTPVAQDLDARSAGHLIQSIAASRRPLILLGPQFNRSRAQQSVAALEKATGIPVIVMESPRGLRDPALGVVAGKLAEADLVISLGKRLDFTTSFGRPPAIAADARIALIDPDAEMVDRATAQFGERLAVAAIADVVPAIKTLIDLAPEPADDAWRTGVARALEQRTDHERQPGTIHPVDICRAVGRVLSGADDPVLICDGGEFGQWAQAFTTARTRIINGPAGAIGGGLCFAIAAKLARPQATVAVMMGDGTAGFHFAEFDTARREETPVLAVIGNDDRWNAEHQIQLREYGRDRLIGCQLAPGTRYDLAASGFGCHGEYVTDPEDLDAALRRAEASGLPACINVAMDGIAAPDHHSGNRP